MQRIKDIVLTVIATTTIICATQSIMATVKNIEIPVSYNDIEIIIDGQLLKTEKEPFIYDGTTYLPVRAVAEAVGKEVEWVPQTNTVLLTTNNQYVDIEQFSEILLYNDNGIKIVFKGVSDGLFGKKVNLYIENNTTKDYVIQVKEFSINGYMISPVFSCEVSAGKKANDDLTILSTSLDVNNIKEIDDVEFIFDILNSENSQDSIITEKITLSFN